MPSLLHQDGPILDYGNSIASCEANTLVKGAYLIDKIVIHLLEMFLYFLLVGGFIATFSPNDLTLLLCFW